MTRAGLIATALLLLLFQAADAVAGASSQASSLATAATLYDDFMKLSVDQRRNRFDAINAEYKAMIVRTHAERWLQRNRGRLTAGEAAVFEEIIAFITTDLDRMRADAALDRREEALRAKMKCRVSPEDVGDATSVLRDASNSPVSKPTWTYLRRAKCWIEWIVEGLVDYIPSSEDEPSRHNIRMEATRR